MKKVTFAALTVLLALGLIIAGCYMGDGGSDPKPSGNDVGTLDPIGTGPSDNFVPGLRPGGGSVSRPTQAIPIQPIDDWKGEEDELPNLVMRTAEASKSPGGGFRSVLRAVFAVPEPFGILEVLPMPSARTNSSKDGGKITSNAHSNDFPGIIFIWAQNANQAAKQKDDGYLKVHESVFQNYVSFVLTIQSSSKYFDFNIMPLPGQLKNADDCYVFFIDRAKLDHNINQVWLTHFVERRFEENDTGGKPIDTGDNDLKPRPKPEKGTCGCKDGDCDADCTEEDMCDDPDGCCCVEDDPPPPGCCGDGKVCDGHCHRYNKCDNEDCDCDDGEDPDDGTVKGSDDDDPPPDGDVPTIVTPPFEDGDDVDKDSGQRKYVIISTPSVGGAEVDTNNEWILPGTSTHIKDLWSSTIRNSYPANWNAMMAITSKTGEKPTWIWDREDSWEHGVSGWNAVINASRFYLKGTINEATVPFYFACDNAAALYVNGYRVGYTAESFSGRREPGEFSTWRFEGFTDDDFNGDVWYYIEKVDIKDFLIDGYNEILVLAANSDENNGKWNKENNPAGLIFGCQFSTSW